MANLIQGINDLATVNPQLANEWHPTKNGDLTPYDVTVGSRLKAWWLLSYDDPKTSKHFDFEWQSSINDRNKGTKCPYLNGTLVLKGFNDLATVNPQLASEWHPTKNGDLTPYDVRINSDKKVWWLLSYDDPKTGKHFEFEWQSSIGNRTSGNGCPFLTSSKTEVLLYDIIKKQNISFIAEYKYSNCKNIGLLPFDLYLPNENILIELDGQQHFTSIDYFGGKEHFIKQKQNDNIKNQYCLDNNIHLLRVPYIYDPIVDKDKIETIVMNFIRTKHVPQEIIEFYSKHNFNNYSNYAKLLNLDLLKKVS